jgi:hypothetical protein
MRSVTGSDAMRNLRKTLTLTVAGVAVLIIAPLVALTRADAL